MHDSVAFLANNVAVVRNEERPSLWRFVSTETSLASAPLTADFVLAVRPGAPPDDDLFRPGGPGACFFLAASVVGPRLSLQAFRAENPFFPLSLEGASSLELGVAERWEQTPLMASGGGVTCLFFLSRLVWMTWRMETRKKKEAVVSFVSHEVLLEANFFSSPDDTVSALAVCGHGDRVAVGFVSGAVRVVSRDGHAATVLLRNCSVPIVEISRVAARVVLVVARESPEKVRLFLAHILHPKSATELAMHFPVSNAMLKPNPPTVTSTPLRPFVCSVAVVSTRQVFFCSLGAACALLDSHAIDSEANEATLPLQQLSVPFERVILFDGPVSSMCFPLPGTIQARVAGVKTAFAYT